MKVLVVSTVRYRRNGISSVIENLFCSNAFENTNISFLFPIDNDPTMIQKLERRGFHVYVKSRKNPVSYFWYLTKLLRQQHINIIHVHGNSSTMALELLAARLVGCKIRIAHSHSTSCLSVRLHNALAPLFHGCCTHCLACGTEAGKWLFQERPFTIVNNGIQTKRFIFSENARKDVRERYHLTDKDILLGHVGIINEGKNQNFLLDILEVLVQRNQNYYLMLVGEGPLRQSIEQRAAEMGLADKVIFVGVTDNVPAYLSAFDLLVMPSLFEGLPLALIEEQANGLQCIISENITREVDKTGNVIFLPLSDGAQRWANIISSIELPNNRAAQSQESIKKITANGYDIQTEAENLKRLYEQALNGEM